MDELPGIARKAIVDALDLVRWDMEQEQAQRSEIIVAAETSGRSDTT